MFLNSFGLNLNFNNMKKLFLSLMLVAAVAAGFVGCKKTASESDTHTQTFSLGETSYDIDNVITIENIQYNGSQIYNAIVFSHGQMTGNNGGEGQGVVIIFRGDLTAGTYNMTFDPAHPTNHFPMYLFAALEVEDIVNFNIDDLLAQDDVYAANSGSFTLEMDGDMFTVTTDGIEVEKTSDAAITETSSVDCESEVARYELATVEEGNINGVNIVTAGATKITYQKVLCFITETANMIGYFYSDDSIPTGTINNATLFYVDGMDTSNIQLGSSTISIEKDGDVYTVNIDEVTMGGQTYTLHYVGTLPFFDLPF